MAHRMGRAISANRRPAKPPLPRASRQAAPMCPPVDGSEVRGPGNRAQRAKGTRAIEGGGHAAPSNDTKARRAARSNTPPRQTGQRTYV
eukprot:7042377-Pyramimonas_sp.AAC.1